MDRFPYLILTTVVMFLKYVRDAQDTEHWFVDLVVDEVRLLLTIFLLEAKEIHLQMTAQMVTFIRVEVSK